MDDIEIDEGTEYTGFDESVRLVHDSIRPLGTEELPIMDCSGYIAATDAVSAVNSPSLDSSAKDGYAVRSNDIKRASESEPVILTIVGSAFAGGSFQGQVLKNECALVCTGAPIPAGADAVIASELCEVSGERVTIRGGIDTGRNITPVGDDIRFGTTLVRRGQPLTPYMLTCLAAGGIGWMPVYKKPVFALISIGDELTEPGTELGEGQIYASNLVFNGAWLTSLGIRFYTAIVKDDTEKIGKTLETLLPKVDGVITSGGVMHSERDMIVSVLNDSGWDMKFRHVRMGPGKATAFGMLDEKPVFCFSGGPSSNQLSFIQFAVPGIWRMQGLNGDPIDTVNAWLTDDLSVRHPDWTEFREGRLGQRSDGGLTVTPLTGKSRIQVMAESDCLIRKPEGVANLAAGTQVNVQVLPKMAGCQAEVMDGR